MQGGTPEAIRREIVDMLVYRCVRKPRKRMTPVIAPAGLFFEGTLGRPHYAGTIRTFFRGASRSQVGQ